MQPQNTIKTNWIYRLKWWAKATQFANMFRIRLSAEFYFEWFPESCMRWSPLECSQYQLYSSKSHRNQDIWFGFSFHINVSELESVSARALVVYFQNPRYHSAKVYTVCVCVCLFICMCTNAFIWSCRILSHIIHSTPHSFFDFLLPLTPFCPVNGLRNHLIRLQWLRLCHTMPA